MNRIFTFLLFAVAFSINAMAVFPMYLRNTSHFNDDEVYIGIIGQRLNGEYIYFDLSENSSTDIGMTTLTRGINTLHKTSGDWGYADIFVRLSDIKDQTIFIDQCQACRMFIGFKSPMYLHSFGNYEGEEKGYAGANLHNASDPNADLRWEIIEFSYDQYDVMFVNTTRVDAFQYPMGIDLWGNVAAGANNEHMRRGDLLTYAEIIDRWKTQTENTIYSNCLIDHITKDNLGGIIMQPSKVSSVANSNLFDSYINAIWSTFSTKELYADMGELGKWRGSVNGSGEFVMTRESDNAVAKVPRKPSTTEAIEGAGSFAEGSKEDKALQAMFCGAVNRGMIDLNKASGELQEWGTQNKFYTMNTWNEYVRFFHDAEVSHDTYTYAFAYDDTFDQSSTCATSHPDHLDVWIGGFVENPGEGDTSEADVTDDPQTPGAGGGSASLEGDIVESGTTVEGINYTYAIKQEGTKVTYTFVVTNAGSFTGLVSHLWETTNGFNELLDRNTHTFDYPVGTIIKVAGRWAYAGGVSTSPYIEYTVKGDGNTGGGSEEEGGNGNEEGGSDESATTGTTPDGLMKYTCAITQEGLNVTYTFTAVNASDFVGLVNHIWDNTNGFHEILNTNTYTFENCKVGDVLKVACKWAFAGGMTTSEYIEYTVKDLSVVTKTGDIEVSFAVYPNPATDYLKIAGCAEGQNIEVYDITGRKVISEKAAGAEATISLAGLKNGKYVVRVGSHATVIAKK